MGKREEKSQETRRLLLAAAEERIRMSGYEQVSVAEITRAAGVAKGTFYNYFEKKEDLIRALYHSHFEELNAGITALAEGDACAGIRGAGGCDAGARVGALYAPAAGWTVKVGG